MPILGFIIKKAYELRNYPLDQKKKKQTDPFETQEKVLKKLIRKAQFTAFGEHFDFTDIIKQKNVVKAFSQKVPIYDYNTMFRKWWYRALNGEAFVAIRQLVSTVKYSFPIEFYEKGFLMIGGSTHLQYNGTYYEGDLSGISAGNLPF